ncbi:RBBP9/YdeN family alpha/beta hydrolase [Acinetobacter soli]|uniref:RBBP9/YdeN family alpha/beta hydrolase n=1 Tax=Acinetobacter soli TaxID=487316 RepID=UPI001ABC0CCB|nr:alpha/beta hydrolase [Acinetobacter soli]MBO3671617.1 serine hydrolase family protein [Acinetobacter soli]
MQHVYVLHGYSASPEDHWFQDIKNQLNGDQTQVTLIHFPDSAYPDVKAWQGTLDHHIPKIDDTTFFVAHSLGVISLLHFFHRHQIQYLGGMLLVSGFREALPALPELDDYIAQSQQIPQTLQLRAGAYMYLSDHDAYVPPEWSIRLALELNIPYEQIAHAGHFLAEDGYTTFPALVKRLDHMLQA